MQIKAVAVTYNSREVILDLLDSLPAACRQHRLEIVVVDNGSGDGTAELVAARGHQVVRAANDGYAAGINKGAAAAGPADAILILNPDVRLEPGCVDRLADALALPRTGIVVPRIVAPDGTLELSLRREPSLLRAMGLTFTGAALLSEHVGDPAAYRRPRTVDWATGAVMLVSSACFDALGGWDESFFLYSEETDFCLRARDRGYLTRYQPEAGAIHRQGASGRSIATFTMQAVNQVRLYRRRHGPVSSWLFFTLLLARMGLRWVGGDRNAISVLKGMAVPARRPPRLGCSNHLMPR